MQLSEKTLEINFVRNFRHPHHLIWQGATLREEANCGWDVKLEKAILGKSLIIQFKRPYAVSTNNGCKTFTFHINNNSNGDQNQILSQLATTLGPKTVFYAFPCVEKLSELASPREAILEKTALADIGQQNLTDLTNGKHKVEIEYCHDTIPQSGLVYSEPKHIELMTVYEYKEWGFDLSRLTELHSLKKEGVKSKRISIKFFTDVS